MVVKKLTGGLSGLAKGRKVKVVEGTGQFAAPNLHAADDEPIARRAVDRCLRKLRLRRSRGLLGRVARRRGAAVLHSHFGPEGWRRITALPKRPLLGLGSLLGLRALD